MSFKEWYQKAHQKKVHLGSSLKLQKRVQPLTCIKLLVNLQFFFYVVNK